MLARSQRVTLRRLREDDVRHFQAYRSDPEIARYQDWADMTDDEARGFLAEMSRVSPILRSGHWTQIAVASVATDRLLGDMGLFLSQDETEAEIGITLARENHGRGLATEAMSLAIDLVFKTPSVERIICGADRRNTSSLALINRLGFIWSHEEPSETALGQPGQIDDMFVLQRRGSFQK